MSKIGDLFVRLGLKKDEFSKGLNEAKKESSSFVDSLKSVGSKGKLAFAAVAAAVGAVAMAIKDLASRNQTLGDEVAKTKAGFTAMFDTLKTSIASMDFSDLVSNLREANNLARDLYDAWDAMGEIQTGYNIALNEQLKHINELKIALRDQTLSDEDRIKAGEELLRIYKELEKNPTRGLSDVMNATLDQYMQRMGITLAGRTDKQMEAMRKKYLEFFKWLGTEQGQSYLEAAKQVSKSGGLDSYLGRTFMANAQKQGRGDFARLAVNYNDKMSDEDREKIEKAVAAYYQQEAKYSQETLRIQTQINSLKSQNMGSPSGASTDKAQEQAQAILKRAEDSAKGELQILREKFEQEKALLEQYGLDTSALWDEYTRNFQNIIDTNLSDFTVEIDLELGDIDMSEVDAEIQASIDAILAQMDSAQAMVDNFANAIVYGFSDAVQELADQFAGLTDINPGGIVQALLTPLADVAIQAGEIIMATGFGLESVKSALESFGLTGPAAIAAGATLIAVGAAAKSGLAALAKSGGRSTSTSSYATSGASAGVQDFQTEMTVYVKGTIKGSDIVLSGQKTLNNWGR